MGSTWLGILALCGVAALGLVVARFIARWKIPEVLAYLLIGIVLGPEVLGILNVHLLERSAFIPQLLLGFVAFMLGELLTPSSLPNRRLPIVATAVLAVALPLVLVTGGTLWLTKAPIREAITLGVLAMAGAPATVLAIRQALGDRSKRGDSLATLAALDNLLVVLVYGTLAPFLVASVAQKWSVWSALFEVLVTVAGGTILGLVGAWLLSVLSAGEDDGVGRSLAAALLALGALVASSLLIGASPLIACAVAGIGTAVREKRVPETSRAFDALRSLEQLVYVFFFVFAGTEINFGHLMAAGTVALVYVVGRSIGKIAAGFAGGLMDRQSLRESTMFGFALLPQAGVVVGLALDAAARFPYVGADILAAVMAALVVFELVGPFAVQGALAVSPGSRLMSPPPNKGIEQNARR